MGVVLCVLQQTNDVPRSCLHRITDSETKSAFAEQGWSMLMATLASACQISSWPAQVELHR